jgi:hypothetical protein
MCTVSVVVRERSGSSQQSGFIDVRLATNRDEQRSRPPALPPVRRRFGEREAILPVDSASGGTWVAANDAGLILTLLNLNPVARRLEDLTPEAIASVLAKAKGKPSRGVVIPSLLHCRSIDEVLAESDRLAALGSEPFRLVTIDARELAELTCADGQVALLRRTPLDAPLMFASSGLGDQTVYEPRRKLFEEMLAQGNDVAATQDAFHRHQWPGREYLSVCMSRADARTVSCTIVEREGNLISMKYFGDWPNEQTGSVALSLSIREEALR